MKLANAREVEREFLKKAWDYMNKDFDKSKLHLTDLCAACYREVWFEKKDPLPEKPENVMRMWIGKMLHEMPLLPKHELELEFDGVVTRIDEYDPERGILVEKKFVTFMPNGEMELKDYYGHYLKQIAYEALVLTANGYKVNDAYLLFVSVAPQQYRLPMAAFKVDVSVLPRQQFKADRDILLDYLNSDEPPPIKDNFNMFQFPCSYCKYIGRCFVQ